MKKFLVSNRLEILSIFALVFAFLLLMLIFGLHLGHINIDCGREAYFPLRMLKGDVLYKNLFNVYGPLSYQLNALLFKIFGANLDTLRIAGATCALAIILLLYAIARLFTSRAISFFAALFIMITCAFSPWLFNFIFPYSFAMTYALCAFLCSLFFLMLNLKTDKQYFIPMSWFFIGISVASKYEYLFYFALLVVFTLIRADKKHVGLSLISFFLVPAVSFLVLFSQGLTIPELFSQVLVIKNLVNAPSLRTLYLKAGLFPEKSMLILSLQLFVQFFVSFVLALASVYYLIKLKSQSIFRSPLRLLSLVVASISLYYLFLNIEAHQSYAFSWLPIFTCFVFGFMLFKKPKIDKLFLIFTFFAVISAVKSFFWLNFFAYGTFAFPLLFIANVVFLCEYLPQYFKSIDKQILKTAFLFVFSGLLILYFGTLIQFLKNDALLKTQNGDIYNPSFLVDTYSDAIKYINKNMKESDTFLAMPEGIMLNFLTNHASKSFYYSTIPPYIETFGEAKIITDLKNDPPDYIFINNRNSSEYGKAYMCKDFGLKICEYVKSSYLPIETFGKGFKMTLYKRILD